MKTTRKLKVGLVLDDTLDTPDGVQQYVLAVGQWLASKGHEVHYLVGQTARTDLPHMHSLGRNVRVRFNRNRMSIPLPVSPRSIRALLAREQFDVLHVQAPYSPMLGARVIRAAGPRTAVVGTFHVAPHSRLVHGGNRALALALARSLKRLDTMMYVSPPARDFGLATFKRDGPVVPNGVDLRAFYAAEPFTAYEQVPTIMFLGRLVERKGCQHLLAAVAAMRQGKMFTRPCKVVVCGAGPLEASLKKYVAEQHLENMVEFKGFISEADKPRYLASADVVVYPSTGGESFGIVLVEAMAASRGVVLAGDNPGYASVLADHPENLFDPHNHEALAHKIAALLGDEAARAAAHEWQHELARQFDMPVIGERILAVYAQALHVRRG